MRFEGSGVLTNGKSWSNLQPIRAMRRSDVNHKAAFLIHYRKLG